MTTDAIKNGQMELTAFGWVSFRRESRTELKERARELSYLHSQLTDAPYAIEVRRGQIGDVRYFIDRARAKKMDVNDHDGLQRLIGQPEDLLTQRDCREMMDPKLWRWSPPGTEWWAGSSYCITLHRKQTAYLQRQVDWIQEEIDCIEADLPEIKARIEKLRGVGPLPEDIATRHQLNVDGSLKLRKGLDNSQ